MEEAVNNNHISTQEVLEEVLAGLGVAFLVIALLFAPTVYRAFKQGNKTKTGNGTQFSPKPTKPNQKQK